ncbi:hypothetical protein BDV38DRAFT_270017 [Aspergillus pseudotamarii]|uniref:Uncharacterized protein n=1 Tax=Aspergillus pseudotamarii TaxID=132259 RepID=A0A5N6SWT9_ASPPS|nr:uncharacterized protein BDV38DRAFT_270017 [Aspergillus pseudotamarii]KAE8139146.1 hypothetical protein BDV38DRAFT_270017 [Aspergillus pseudotamarii]
MHSRAQIGTPTPLATDFLYDIDCVTGPMSSAYIPIEMPTLANYWVTMIELSRLLGTLLTVNYQTVRVKPLLHQVEALEEEALQCELPNYEARFSTVIGTNLCDRAMLITFYRPFGTEIPGGLRVSQQDHWREQMALKAHSAASKLSAMLYRLTHLEWTTPLLFFPAMQLHLLRCRFDNSLSEYLKRHKLDMLMLIMEELQKTYAVASIYRGIFSKGIKQIFSAGVPRTVLTEPAPVGIPAREQSAACEGPALERSQSQDEPTTKVLDALIDEASLFSFRGLLNRQ